MTYTLANPLAPRQLLFGALPETVTSMEESEGQGALQDDERGGR